MDREQIVESLETLFRRQNLAVLSTQQGGQPYGSLVAFVVSDDLRELFFATGRATRKYSNICSDSRVALLVDNRSNQPEDFHEAMAVTVVGRAREVTREEREPLEARYLAKHPHLSDFLSSPSCSLLCVDVATYYVVRRFQTVAELHLNT